MHKDIPSMKKTVLRRLAPVYIFRLWIALGMTVMVSYNSPPGWRKSHVMASIKLSTDLSPGEKENIQAGLKGARGITLWISSSLEITSNSDIKSNRVFLAEAFLDTDLELRPGSLVQLNRPRPFFLRRMFRHPQNLDPLFRIGLGVALKSSCFTWNNTTLEIRRCFTWNNLADNFFSLFHVKHHDGCFT